jgi:type II secretory pathway pseudopilin PulG
MAPRRVLRRFTRGSSERGATVVEFAVAVVIMAFLGAIVVGWVSGVLRVNIVQSADDEALQDLVLAREAFTKDVRQAQGLSVASASTLTMWIDVDRDDAVDAGETVSWTIEADGDFVRSTDVSTRAPYARALDTDASAFGYDAASAAQVTRVALTLVIDVERFQGTASRSLSSEVYLRSKGLGS